MLRGEQGQGPGGGQPTAPDDEVCEALTSFTTGSGIFVELTQKSGRVIATVTP